MSVGYRYGGPVSPVSDLPSVEQLKRFILRCIQAPSKKMSFSYPSVRRMEFRMLIGICLRVRRLAQAYLRLERAGFSPEGRVIVRSALEHAVTAQWAHLIKGGMQRLTVEATRSQAKAARVLAKYSTDPAMHALAAEFAAARLEGEGMPRFSGPGNIISQLDNNGFIETSYTELSLAVHPTHRTVIDALKVEGEKVSIVLEPVEELDHELLYTLAAACMLSTWIIAHLTDDSAEMATLREQANELQLRWRLDAAVPAQQRRFELDA